MLGTGERQVYSNWNLRACAGAAGFEADRLRGYRFGLALISAGSDGVYSEIYSRQAWCSRRQISASFTGADSADTYGIIVYQEQIMQIASAMAGFSLRGSGFVAPSGVEEEARGARSSSGLISSRQHRARLPEEEANRVYDMIVRFADYGFPRAHAAAYGVLAFQTAYLKAHYPVPFMASMLAAVIGNQRKTAEYVDECRRMGIEVLPPDVNESDITFTPVGDSDPIWSCGD